MQNWLTSNRAKDLVYIYINSKLLREQPDANLTTWYEKNMLFQNLISNVDDSVDENDSLGEDSITSNELNEDEVEHNPFEFPHDDEIPCSRLLSK